MTSIKQASKIIAMNLFVKEKTGNILDELLFNSEDNL